ncbi:hypothetical protein OSTOST_17226, partial [Ostertagia ostertagi]
MIERSTMLTSTIVIVLISLSELSIKSEVSEEEYTHCFLQNPHLVGSCNNNTQDVTITVVFRQFTPTPGGMEFEPGKTYHFI